MCWERLSKNQSNPLTFKTPPREKSKLSLKQFENVFLKTVLKKRHIVLWIIEYMSFKEVKNGWYYILWNLYSSL